MIRTSEDEYVAYSQKCTHLSCAVYLFRKERAPRMPVPSRLFLGERWFRFTGTAAASPSPDQTPERDGTKLVAIGGQGKLRWPTSNQRNNVVDWWRLTARWRLL